MHHKERMQCCQSGGDIPQNCVTKQTAHQEVARFMTLNEDIYRHLTNFKEKQIDNGYT